MNLRRVALVLFPLLVVAIAVLYVRSLPPDAPPAAERSADVSQPKQTPQIVVSDAGMSAGRRRRTRPGAERPLDLVIPKQQARMTSTRPGAPAEATQAAPATADNLPLWSSAGGSAAANANSHWQKHGSEFPEYHSAQEYIDGAHKFVSNPPAGTLRKSRGNGDRLFFDPKTGTFAVQAADGAPRTMFRPNNGMDYWSRQ